jgi:hypothetical protein
MRSVLVAMLAVAMLGPLGAAPSEAQVSPQEYQQEIETLFRDWNARKPQKRSDLRKAIDTSIKIQLERRVRFYHDPQWAADILAKVERDVPAEIIPRLSIDEEAFKRYRGLPESRFPEYSKLFPRDVMRSDLTAKFYLFMAEAEKLAATRRAPRIEFPDLRRAMFFWESGVWPFCY